MPVSLNDNTCARIKKYDEKTVVFFSQSANGTASVQSLASLMNGLSKRGYCVHHVTFDQPAGDDFITADDVERHVLSNLENDGMPSSVSFLRVLGAIPAKTVVLWGTFTKRMYQCYLAAKSLGRCVVFYQSQSPVQPLSAGAHNLVTMYNNTVAGCDAVITPCDKDESIFKGLGAKMCEIIPFYFPYDTSEVSPSTVANREIAFFSSFSGRSTKNIIAAFALLHEKYPDATMHMILMNSVKINASSDALMKYVEQSGLSDVFTIERKVLKPLRALRQAGISITYAHYEHMPQTVLESVTAGIPALLACDADYSGSSLPFDCVNAADTMSIYKLLDKYMEQQAREEYRENARLNLSADVRTGVVDKWEKALAKAESGFEERVDASSQISVKITDAIVNYGNDKEKCASQLRKLLFEGAVPADLFGAMLYCSMKKEEIIELFNTIGIAATYKMYDIETRFRFLNVIAPSVRKGMSFEQAVASVKKGIYTGFEIQAMLAQSGATADGISKALGIAGDRYLRHSLSNSLYLLNTLYNNETKPDTRLYSACENSSYVGMRNSLRNFLSLNQRTLKFKNHFFVRRAIKFHDWLNSPWDFKSPLEKAICAPFFAKTLIKRKLYLKGKQRLNKRKVVEVASSDTRKIQLLVLMLLLELDRICKKYNLTYYLAGGSILGGVRHKGFIPWDDDIDITMPRPDYDKFIKVCQKELPEEYYLDKDCVPFCHNRIEIRGTDFTTFFRKGAVFLDILALEGSPDDEALRREHERKCKFWRSCMLEKARPFPVFDFSSKAKIKRYIACSILRFVPRWFLKYNWERWAKKYSVNETSSWVCLPASIYTYEQERFPKEYWGKPVNLEFEGMQLPTMSHWEDYLVCHFGDYMKMPPETTRKSHHYIFSYTLGKYGEMSEEEIEKMFLDKRKEYLGY